MYKDKVQLNLFLNFFIKGNLRHGNYNECSMSFVHYKQKILHQQINKFVGSNLKSLGKYTFIALTFNFKEKSLPYLNQIVD